jgi:nitric oxide reductase NorQ protein
VAAAARRLKGHGLDEGISTRLLVYAGQLIRQGIAPREAARMAMVRPITDDADIRERWTTPSKPCCRKGGAA